MTGTRFSLAPLFIPGAVFLLVIFSINAFADAFIYKSLRFDGKVTKGKLDNNNNLEFSGWASWGGPVAVRFSQIVRAEFGLAPFIETEAEGILGAFTVTLSFTSKTRGVSYQNLRIKILDRGGDEIASSGMVSRSGSGWVLGIAAEQQPFDIHISYSPEKGSILAPASSEDKDNL